MSDILKRVASTMHRSFQASTPADVFALKLAQRLGEPETASHYAALASHHSREKLLCAYHRAAPAGGSGRSPAQVFHDYLADSDGPGPSIAPPSRLLAISVERRAVAVAVFSGLHLAGHRVLQLSSNPRRAETSTAGFIRSTLSENDCQSAVAETVAGDTLRSALCQTALTQCRAADVAVWEVSKKSVFAALGHPPLRSRGQVRDLMLRMWPLLELKHSHLCALDAFAVGLYVQTERLFAPEF